MVSWLHKISIPHECFRDATQTLEEPVSRLVKLFVGLPSEFGIHLLNTNPAAWDNILLFWAAFLRAETASIIDDRKKIWMRIESTNDISVWALCPKLGRMYTLFWNSSKNVRDQTSNGNAFQPEFLWC